MTDHFAVLGEARRPWLEEDALKERFLELTSQHHPDVAHAANAADAANEAGQSGQPTAVDFSAINLAYQTLRDPRARLRHLLELELEAAGENASAEPKHQAPPEAINALFARMGTIKMKSDTFLQKRGAATSAVAKALLLPEQFALQEELEEWLAELEGERLANLALLPSLDTLWLAGRSHPQHKEVVATLGQMVQLFGYLDRWIAQIRELLVKLQILP